MVTTEVSALVPPCWMAMTRKVPGLLPAKYVPTDEMLPPVASYKTPTGPVFPSLQVPVGENCCMPPSASATAEGESTRDISVGDAVGVELRTVTAAVSDAPQLHAATTRKLPTSAPGEYAPDSEMTPPVVLQVMVTGWVNPSDQFSVAPN